MRKPFIALVDLDNVIADQLAGFYQAIAKQYPEIKLPDRNTLAEFNLEYNFPYDDQKKIKSLRLQEGFFRDLPLIEGAREGLERLADQATHVWIVTAPTWEWRYCVPEKFEWVEKHLGRDWTGKIILTRDKTFVKGNILIDDSPSVSGIWAQEWTHILYDQPYNRNVDMPRVTWKTIGDFLKEWKAKLDHADA